MSKGVVTIVYLYPAEMNIYGDWGNVLTLCRRLQWHGYEPKIRQHSPGKPFPKDGDIFVGGGGQDSGQFKVAEDLVKNQRVIQAYADRGTPMLLVCGMYQLFGRSFQAANDQIMQGIGVFAAETYAGSKRMIGNIVIQTPFGEIAGYENHGGKTMLDSSQAEFGKVKKGAGNNGSDGTEGAVYKNVFGTYLHGSLLPKNPVFADALIEKAITIKFGEFEPNVIDDTFADKARSIAKNRPR